MKQTPTMLHRFKEPPKAKRNKNQSCANLRRKRNSPRLHEKEQVANARQKTKPICLCYQNRDGRSHQMINSRKQRSARKRPGTGSRLGQVSKELATTNHSATNRERLMRNRMSSSDRHNVGCKSNGRPKSYRLISSLGSVLHCLLYTSPSPRDRTRSRMPSSA